MSQPLTDAIEALTTYANEVTGESDTTLSDAVGSLVSGYGGGGSSMQTGSFTATATTNVTLSVSSLCSHIYIYHSTARSDDDLSNAPYGTSARIGFYADGNTGFCYHCVINSSGTAYEGSCTKIGRWGSNTQWIDRVEFSSSQIKIINTRYNGSSYYLIDGATYNWIAW